MPSRSISIHASGAPCLTSSSAPAPRPSVHSHRPVNAYSMAALMELLPLPLRPTITVTLSSGTSRSL